MRALLTRLRRRPATAPWPGNLRTIAADLREALDHNAELAAKLTAARQRADLADARAAADRLERQAAEQREAQARRELRTVREQLHNAIGYDAAELAAIESGAGQPRKA